MDWAKKYLKLLHSVMKVDPEDEYQCETFKEYATTVIRHINERFKSTLVFTGASGDMNAGLAFAYLKEPTDK